MQRNFSFRTREELLKQLGYMAEYNGRSANKELEQLLIRAIRDFEKTHGSIPLDDDEGGA